MKKIIISLCALFLVLNSGTAEAQVAHTKKLSIKELFQLALDSNQQLKVARMGIDVASQKVNVAETQLNPTFTANAGAFYLGDATVFDKNLANKVSIPMPHFGNSFAVQASQTVFKGGAIKNNIAINNLQQQLATLNYDKNSMDVRLLLAGSYFDLFRLYNQRAVYEKNINLAQLRINNINKMYKQGMVTRNDIIRNELLITNLNTAVQQLTNNITIISQQLDIALGLPENTFIIPDSTILNNKPEPGVLDNYLDYAYQNYPDIKLAAVNSKIAEKSVAIAKADRLPAINLSAGNSLNRPVTSSSPARDMYSNGWQAGVGISFNISSLYNSKQTVKLANMQLAQQRETEELQRQNVEMGVKAAYIKHREANQLTASAEKSLQLADENFRIVEKKYMNQMAVLTDLMDATNAKLDAELQKTNAEISILYTYYQLQKATGNL
jgi:outer membrane protein